MGKTKTQSKLIHLKLNLVKNIWWWGVVDCGGGGGGGVWGGDCVCY